MALEVVFQNGQWALRLQNPMLGPSLLSMDQAVVLQNCWLHSKICLKRHKINKTGQVSSKSL